MASTGRKFTGWNRSADTDDSANGHLNGLYRIGSCAKEWLRNAAALGLSHWGIIKGVALPAAKTGIAAGIILAAARALGETMAVLMVAGNVVQYPETLFDPVRTLAANIALEAAYAMGITVPFCLCQVTPDVAGHGAVGYGRAAGEAASCVK